MSQMWVSGIIQLVVGRHSKGQFRATEVEHMQIKHELQEWWSDNRNTLRKFVGIVLAVRKAVCHANEITGQTCFALVYQGKNPDSLGLFRREEGQVMLSETIIHRVFIKVKQ